MKAKVGARGVRGGLECIAVGLKLRSEWSPQAALRRRVTSQLTSQQEVSDAACPPVR